MTKNSVWFLKCAVPPFQFPQTSAEGQARRTTGDYVRFVSIAEGSLAELDTQLIVAIELSFCTKIQTKEKNRSDSRS